jgi:hypothetical protein
MLRRTFAHWTRMGAVLAGLASLLTACEIGTVTVPKTEADVVVHAVLNPSATMQVVLLERTLSGAANVPDTTFDGTDPIASAGGIPISGATVEILDSLGRTFRGVEDQIGTAPTVRGTGVYRVLLAGSALVLGARYQLRISTPTGEQVNAFTRLPRPEVRSAGALNRTMNRDHDVLNVQWTAVPAARTYAVRIESPFGPFFLFTDSTRIRLDGDLRNLFAGELQHVFIPGFRQDVLIAAVDSNFYDYYRTNNDPFTGSGIISRINGGIGLFGSIVSLTSGTVTVIADRTEPVEGRYRLLPASSSGPTPFTSDMTVYIESKAARSDLPTALSGRYVSSTGRVDGIIGEEQDGVIKLSLLNNQLSGSKLDTFTGTLRGDTLVGSFQRSSAGGTLKYLRTP